jgi:hypothetical protein
MAQYGCSLSDYFECLTGAFYRDYLEAPASGSVF